MIRAIIFFGYGSQISALRIDLEGASLKQIMDSYGKQIFEQAYKKYRITTEIARELGIGKP